MSRGVLGNDPFRRGAAARPDEAADTGDEKPRAKVTPKKGAASKGGAKKTAPAKTAKAKKPAPTTSARKTGNQKAGKTTAGPGTDARTAPGRASTQASDAAPAAASRASTPAAGQASAGGSSARGTTSRAPSSTVASDPKPKRAAKATASAPRASSGKRATGQQSGASEAPRTPRRPAMVGSDGPRIASSVPHLTPVEPTADQAPRTGPSADDEATPKAPRLAEVVTLPGRDPATSRPAAPHLMLVSEGAPQQTEAPQPRFPRDDDDLATRAGRALDFVRDLAAAGLQGPTLTRSARVGRGLVRAALGGVGALWGQEVDAYGRDGQLVQDLEPLTELLYAHYWRVVVQGAVHVPEGPVLLVANHAGVMPYDGPVLQQVLTRERPDLAEARWLIEDQIFHAPFFGTLFNRLGALRACPQNARQLLSERRPVIVFPEGAQGLGKPYQERDRLKRFGRGGFVKIALRAGVPIVPVAIVGSEETSPLVARLPGSIFGLGYIPVTPFGPLPLPARWMVRFGEPLQLDGAGPDDADSLPVVQRLSERTRDSIQGMREALLRERGGPYFG